MFKKLKPSFWKYSWSQVFVTIYTLSMTIFFVDYIGVSYWKFALIFIPFTFLSKYLIYEYYAFRKEEG